MISIKTFGQRVKTAWNNIYELEKNLDKIKLLKMESRREKKRDWEQNILVNNNTNIPPWHISPIFLILQLNINFSLTDFKCYKSYLADIIR